MPFGEAIRLALRMLWSQKMKSGFSLVGVFIGVTFLIAVVSIVEGMNRYMTERFAGTFFGVNTFHLRRFPAFSEDVPAETWRLWRRRPRITEDDARAVEAGLTVPVTTAWQSTASATVQYRGRIARDIEITGATETYFEIKNYRIERGRSFTAQEVRAAAPVIVVGNELARRLFDDRDPLGREIKIRDNLYRVIGVVEAQGNLFGISLDKFAVAPATAPVKKFTNPPGLVDAVLIRAASVPEMRLAMEQTEAIMRSRRNLRPNQDNNFALETSEGILDVWGKINRILLAALPGLVSISLVVGGIVIMNIMLMAVAERTREIGIRKALGARRRDIMRQFLVESATLAVVGALIGIATGVLLAQTIASTTPLPASVAPWSILVGVLLGGGVGIAAGLYPASRAARLDPVDAMRHE
ncbi:MAG: ABC transporter permease [Gemmatimonadetes bacterium]|nr:ABC transporter permease [Gemmatimonadota bacterium]